MCETLARYVARLRALGHQVEPQGEAFFVRSVSPSDAAGETVPTALLGFYVRVAEIEAMAISAHAAVAGSSIRPID